MNKHPDMQEPGDACQSCYNFWKFQNKKPMTMVLLFDGNGEPICTDNGIPIVVCPRCDGDLILRLPKG